MSDDYDKVAELVRSGHTVDEALNKVAQTLPQSTTTVLGGVELATDAEVTTGTDTSRVPPVSSLVKHEGVCKAWVAFNGTGTVAIQDSYNVSSITDNGVGNYTVNFTNNLANANYVVNAQGKSTSSNLNVNTNVATRAVGSFTLNHYEKATPVLTDSSQITVSVFGDQ